MIEISEELPVMHQYLVRCTTERIETAYVKAIRQGILNPAVFVMDQSAEAAQAIIELSGKQAEAQRSIARAEERDRIPVTLWHLPAHVAAKALPAGLDELARTLTTWNPWDTAGRFPVVVVGHEAISLVPFPVPQTT